MRILYLARFESRGNCDEESIADALSQLGHTVVCHVDSHAVVKDAGDILLFHKWFDRTALNRLKGRLQRVFWQFDLLTKRPGPLAKNVNSLLPYIDCGFATDGDWVESNKKRANLHWLMQGADQRLARMCGNPRPGSILFAGRYCHAGHGKSERLSWINEMRAVYGENFRQVEGLHGCDLAKAVAESEIVVAPDSPGTDRYWSNRVYLMLGLGAFLVHPWHAGLASQYKDGREIVYYKNRAELHAKIGHFRCNPEARIRIAEAGFLRTRAEHTYVNRMHRFLQIVLG